MSRIPLWIACVLAVALAFSLIARGAAQTSPSPNAYRIAYLYERRHNRTADAFDRYIYRRLAPKLETLLHATLIPEDIAWEIDAQEGGYRDAYDFFTDACTDARAIATIRFDNLGIIVSPCATGRLDHNSYTWLAAFPSQEVLNTFGKKMKGDANARGDMSDLRAIVDSAFQNFSREVAANTSQTSNLLRYGLYVGDREKSGYVILAPLYEGEKPTGQVGVVQALPGGPAARAGLHENDKVVSINREPAKGMSFDELNKVLQDQSVTVFELTLDDGKTIRYEPQDLKWMLEHAAPAAPPAVPGLTSNTGSGVGAVLNPRFLPHGSYGAISDEKRAAYAKLGFHFIDARVLAFTPTGIARACRGKTKLATTYASSVATSGSPRSFGFAACNQEWPWYWPDLNNLDGPPSEYQTEIRNLARYGVWLKDGEKSAFFMLTTFSEPDEMEIYPRLFNAGHPMVSAVLENGPAFQAGLRVGDLVERMNGRSLDGVPDKLLARTIAGAANGPYVLEVERPDGIRARITFSARDAAWFGEKRQTGLTRSMPSGW